MIVAFILYEVIIAGIIPHKTIFQIYYTLETFYKEAQYHTPKHCLAELDHLKYTINQSF